MNLPQGGVIHQIMYGAEYIQDNSEIFFRHAHARKDIWVIIHLKPPAASLLHLEWDHAL